MKKKTERPFSKLELRQWLLKKNGSRCHYCRRHLTLETSTIDHKKPRSRGGTYRKDNVLLACRSCNNAKADMPYSKFKVMLQEKLERTKHFEKTKNQSLEERVWNATMMCDQ